MKLAAGVRWLAVGLVGGTALFVGATQFWAFDALVEEEARDALQALVRDRCERLAVAVEGVRADVDLLARLEGVETVVRERERLGAPGPNEPAALDALAHEFRALLETRPAYAQVRLLGIADGGLEILRLDRQPGGVRRTPTEALQPKAGRGYFEETLRHGRASVYFSAITLNREHGELDVPHAAMMRVGRVVENEDGSPFGLIVVNVDFERFLADLLVAELSRYRVFLANEHGDFLLHPDPSRTYGFDLGFEYELADEFPALGNAPESAAGTTVGLPRTDGRPAELVHFERLPLGPMRELLVGMAATYADVGTQKSAIRSRSAGITAVLLGLALAAAFALSSRITRPLREIGRAAERIAAGEQEVELPTHEANEVGTVARALERMIAALHEKEHGLIDTAASLERANTDLEHFAHAASHDLREPARRVVGLTDLLKLQEQERISSEGRRLIELARGEAHRMLAQISDLRVLAGIGDGQLIRVRVDLAELIGRVVAGFRESIAQRGVRVQVDAAPPVEAYEGLLAVLYRNLVAHALQHGPQDPFDLHFTYARSAEGGVYGVRYTGAALPKGLSNEILEPFRRLRSGEQSGLGLSICKRIVERHAGSIRVESDPGEVRFLFTLGQESP